MGPGRTAIAADIPWDQVNADWFIAEWTAQPARPDGTTPGTVELLLVNPIGGRYLIGNLPGNSSVAGWSADRRRVMIAGSDGKASTYSEWDIARGRQIHSFKVAGESAMVRYTRPNGLAVLISLAGPDGMHRTLQRRSVDGRIELTYPHLIGGVSTIEDTPYYSADGAEFAIGTGGSSTTHDGIALISNDGHLNRLLAAPAGYRSCYMTSWPTESQLQARCYRQSGAQALEVDTPFTIDVVTGHYHQILPAGVVNPIDASWGFSQAYPISSGFFALGDSGCGPAIQLRLRNGVLSEFKPKLPAGSSPRTQVIKVSGDHALLLGASCMGSRGEIVSADLNTGAVTPIIGGPAISAGRVVAVVTLPIDR